MRVTKINVGFGENWLTFEDFALKFDFILFEAKRSVEGGSAPLLRLKRRRAVCSSHCGPSDAAKEWMRLHG